MAYIKQINVGGTAYDIKAAADASGNIIADTYVNKSGDTMTGPLIIQNTHNNVSLIVKPQDISTHYCTIGFNLHDIPNIPNTWFFYHDIINNKLKISHRN